MSMTLYDLEGNVIGSGGGSATLDYDKVVKAICHRGASAYYPENTLPAFKGAKNLGFNYVETDVRFTSDGVMVCLHDESINRTARNSDGTQLSETVNIADITYQEAMAYDFGVFKGSSFANTKILKFDDFLTLCRNLMLHPYVELKVGTEAQIQAIVDAVTAHGLKGKATYISSVSQLLRYVIAYEDTARIGVVSWDKAVSSATALLNGKNEVFFNCMVGQANANVEGAIAGGVGLECWTATSASQVLGLDPYVTGVTTNGEVIAGKVLYDANI